MNLFKFRTVLVSIFCLLPVNVFATTYTYTPLITSSTFDGIRADVTTTAVGIISVLVIIVGVSLIARAFTR